MSKPLVIDLCCGLGGWTRGFLAEGWDAIGFDIERHEYGEKRYPAELILKDIRQVCGYDLRAVNPSLVVASPPCQRYSWMAMPWSLAKREAVWQRWERDSLFGDRLAGLNALFNACFRIARELSVPIVVENVKGAQPWVGRARAHFGSYYLWGDVESVGRRIVGGRPQFGQSLRVARSRKVLNAYSGNKSWKSQNGLDWRDPANIDTKNDGGSWFNVAHNTESGVGQNPVNGVKVPGIKLSEVGFNVAAAQRYRDGVKQTGLSGPAWFNEGAASVSSKSNSRKAASAMIAEIPFDLAQYIAKVFKP